MLRTSIKLLVLASFAFAPSARAEIPVRYWILSDGTAAVNPKETPAQTAALNGWYMRLASFNHASTQVLTRETLRARELPEGCDADTLIGYINATNANQALWELARCLGDRQAVNVFVAKSLIGYGRSLNGIAMINAPLGGYYSPSTLIAANVFFTAAITLSHEVGHILGIQHTATYDKIGNNSVHWHETSACGQSIRYPHFYMSDPWSLQTPAEHQQFPGRRSPMGYLNIYTFFLPGFLIGDYATVFPKIVSCWKNMSGLEGVRRYEAPSPKAIAD